VDGWQLEGDTDAGVERGKPGERPQFDAG